VEGVGDFVELEKESLIWERWERFLVRGKEKEKEKVVLAGENMDAHVHTLQATKIGVMQRTCCGARIDN
jgi:hypothetical protein